MEKKSKKNDTKSSDHSDRNKFSYEKLENG